MACSAGYEESGCAVPVDLVSVRICAQQLGHTLATAMARLVDEARLRGALDEAALQRRGGPFEILGRNGKGRRRVVVGAGAAA